MADETAVLDTNLNPGQVPEPTPPAQDASGSESLEDLREALRKERKDGSKANREAQAAKKETDALKARLQEIEDAKKSDLDKALAKLKQAEEDNANILNTLKAQERKNAARDSGVESAYAEYAASEFAKALTADPELTPVDFFKEFKTTHPAMFGVKPPPGSGAGGPATSGAGDKVSRLSAIADEVKAIMASPMRKTDQAQRRLWTLSEEAENLKKSMNTH